MVALAVGCLVLIAVGAAGGKAAEFEVIRAKRIELRGSRDGAGIVLDAQADTASIELFGHAADKPQYSVTMSLMTVDEVFRDGQQNERIRIQSRSGASIVMKNDAGKNRLKLHAARDGGGEILVWHEDGEPPEPVGKRR